ncbi:hypothetical protein HY642_01205 [Candidatus Woesearchaeota archaeon]|nr:hypothetical protein [Candidatus Woesearchaeota archaeon]
MAELKICYDATKAEPYELRSGRSTYGARNYDELWQQLRDHLKTHRTANSLQFCDSVKLDKSQRAALESIVAYHNDIVRTDRKH